MIQSWVDVIITFVVCWIGLHYYFEARKRRSARSQKGQRDIAASVVMWLAAILSASALTVLTTSFVLAWIVR